MNWLGKVGKVKFPSFQSLLHASLHRSMWGMISPNLPSEIYFCDASEMGLWLRVCIIGYHLICASCPHHHNTYISDYVLLYSPIFAAICLTSWATMGIRSCLLADPFKRPGTKHKKIMTREAHCEMQHWILEFSSKCLFSGNYGVLFNCKLWRHHFLITYLCNETSVPFSFNVTTCHVLWLMLW